MLFSQLDMQAVHRFLRASWGFGSKRPVPAVSARCQAVLALAAALVLVGASPLAVSSARADEVERREIPNYDGRPAVGDDAIDVLLWIPRVITSPLYVVSEYLIRRPVGWLITALEQSDAVRYLLGLFTFGGRQDLVVVPTAFFDFGFAPSVGLFAAWNQFLHDDNRASLHVATGGGDYLTLSFADTVRLPDRMQLRVRLSALKRPDQQVGGIGFDATQAQNARFGVEQIEGGVRFGLRPWPGIEFDYWVDYRSVGYVDEPWSGEPSVGQLGLTLSAFDSGYSSIVVGTRMVFDSRAACAQSEQTSGWDTASEMVSPSDELPDGSCELSTGGVRLALEASEHFGFGGLPSSQWLRLGGEVAAATDFLGRGRVFVLRGRTQAVTPVAGARVVPFTELASLSDAMRGFQPGMAYGSSLAAVTLEYLWPIFAFLDGSLHATIGNVFGDGFEGFDFERLRLSFGVLVAPRVGGDHFFELGLAFGTETFARGSEIASVRFVVGGRNGL